MPDLESPGPSARGCSFKPDSGRRRIGSVNRGIGLSAGDPSRPEGSRARHFAVTSPPELSSRGIEVCSVSARPRGGASLRLAGGT